VITVQLPEASSSSGADGTDPEAAAVAAPPAPPPPSTAAASRLTPLQQQLVEGETGGLRASQRAWHLQQRPRLSCERVVITADLVEDPEVAAIVKKYAALMGSRLDVVIGTTAVDLDGRFSTVRFWFGMDGWGGWMDALGVDRMAA